MGPLNAVSDVVTQVNRCQRGSALVLVAAATAALGTLAAGLLTAALISYETAAMQRDGTQARLLAESALELVGGDLAAGTLVAPSIPGDSVEWEEQLPVAPPGFGPPTSMTDGACGFRVVLTAAIGPDGAQLLTEVDDDVAALVDAQATGWCGRGYATIPARFAVFSQATVRRLY